MAHRHVAQVDQFDAGAADRPVIAAHEQVAFAGQTGETGGEAPAGLSVELAGLEGEPGVLAGEKVAQCQRRFGNRQRGPTEQARVLAAAFGQQDHGAETDAGHCGKNEQNQHEPDLDFPEQKPLHVVIGPVAPGGMLAEGTPPPKRELGARFLLLRNGEAR